MSHSSEVHHSTSGPAKAGPIMSTNKKHDKKVAMLELCTYIYNLFTYKHFHLPQVTDNIGLKSMLPQLTTSKTMVSGI